MDTPAAGPQASTRNSANRRPSYRHPSAHAIATLEQRLCQLESRRASNGKPTQGPVLTRSTAGIAWDTDLDSIEERCKDVEDLTSDLEESKDRMQDRLDSMGNAQNLMEDRLRKLESASEPRKLPRESIVEQLRSRDERLERLEKGLRDRDERLKCLEDTIQPYKMYLDKAREADQTLNRSMTQIKTFLDLKKRSKSASPFVAAPSAINNAETISQIESGKPNLPRESADDVARSLTVMLVEGASIDSEVLIALNAALAKSTNTIPSIETSKETSRAQVLGSRVDPRSWETSNPKTTPVLQSQIEGTSKLNFHMSPTFHPQFLENSTLATPFKSALKSRKRSPLLNGDPDADSPRKRVRISHPLTPTPVPSSDANLAPTSPIRNSTLDSPGGRGITESTPEIRRTPRSSQPRVQPKDMVSWKDANESMRGVRPRTAVGHSQTRRLRPGGVERTRCRPRGTRFLPTSSEALPLCPAWSEDEKKIVLFIRNCRTRLAGGHNPSLHLCDEGSLPDVANGHQQALSRGECERRYVFEERRRSSLPAERMTALVGLELREKVLAQSRETSLTRIFVRWSVSPTSLRIEELPSITTMNGFQAYPSNNSPTQGTRDVSPGPGLLTPIPNGVRRVSGGELTTPLRPVVNGGTPMTPTLSSGDNESSTHQQWSSAIGHATTAGKSGRVIERLMTENDKLKRDLELQSLRVQELEKNAQTYRPQIDALKEKVDSLSHASTMDSSLIARRDRRIEELKADNTQMREGRDSLQRRLREVEKERDEMHEQSQREVQSLTESTKHATVHAEILETSHRQLKAEYTARREAWEHDLRALYEERDEQRSRIARYEIVSEQMRVEAERIAKLQTETLSRWEEYRDAVRRTKDDVEETMTEVREKSDEMDEVVSKMRWVMGLKHAREPQAKMEGEPSLSRGSATTDASSRTNSNRPNR
nr:hypothetical protein CFP56_09893 [Quercus suber]